LADDPVAEVNSGFRDSLNDGAHDGFKRRQRLAVR
jgi:hypothetical protein